MSKRILLVLWMIPCLAAPTSAGIFFMKKNKPNPKERVPELIALVKTDGDENKRSSAAEELRNYDPVAFPEIVPVLIDVLGNDKKPAVRAEAAQTLGKLRPVSQSAGLALEKAQAKDASMMVRLQARISLSSYRWAGYRSIKKDDPATASTKEPPLAGGSENSSLKPIIRRTSQPNMIPTAEVVPVQVQPPVITTIPGARPLPTGPTAPLGLTEPPGVSPVPPSQPKGNGPSLE